MNGIGVAWREWGKWREKNEISNSKRNEKWMWGVMKMTSDEHDGDEHDGDEHDGDEHDGDEHDGDEHDGD